MNIKIQLDPPYLDDEEREIMQAFERGEFQPAADQEASRKRLQQAARETLKKKAITLRVYERDIQRIKHLAGRDGIPYQTLLSSIIHRYAEGTLKRAD